MAITHFLLESNFNSNPLLQKPFHLPSLRCFPTKSHNVALKRNHSSSYKAIRVSPKFKIRCLIMDHDPQGEKGFSKNREKEDHDPKKEFVHSGITGVVLGLLFLYDHHHVGLALAASGGRMGGSSFSSRSSSSRSSSTSSSSSRSSSSPSYSSSGSYSSWTSSPKESSSSSSDEIYRTQTSSPVLVNPKKEDVTVLDIILGFFILTFVALLAMGCYFSNVDQNTVKTSVLMLQVGLLGTARSLQGDLNRIAMAADTSTSKGLSYVLQEATLALLRHPDYFISGYSSVDVKKNIEEGEKLFNQLSFEERGKFDEETLVNVNNIRRQSASSHSSNGLHNEYIVVTIVVAASGVRELPPIKSSAQLKKALQKLASIPSRNIMGVEVLWTPQKENDSLTKEEYLQDYPLLHPL